MTSPSLPLVPTIVSTLPTKPDTNSSWYQSLSGAFDSAASAFDSVMKSNAMAWISPGLWSVYNKGPEIYDALKGKTPYDILDNAVDYFTGDKPLTGSPSGSPRPYIMHQYGNAAKSIDYLYADLAKHYGLSKETAYNEAMANTSYQRAVADMQQAGLNPASLFSSSRASTAATGHIAGGFPHSYSSARGSSQAESLPGWLFYGISALTNIVATRATKNPMTGYAASNVAKEVMRAVNGLLK